MTFTLRSVGEQALPVELVPVSEGAIVRRWWLDSGRLTLQPNGVLRLRLGVRSQLDAGSVEQSEVEVQGTYTSDGSTISLCLENGCLLRSGSPAHAIGGTVSGRDFVTPSLFTGASSPFRFVRE
ncbi:MAG TPA: hypothetical protein VKA84_02915 [Gemmatimonadaceae bacterium]|nr:hypothetical protein [Gemmatimonadaceae bacterium]